MGTFGKMCWSPLWWSPFIQGSMHISPVFEVYHTHNHKICSTRCMREESSYAMGCYGHLLSRFWSSPLRLKVSCTFHWDVCCGCCGRRTIFTWLLQVHGSLVPGAPGILGWCLIFTWIWEKSVTLTSTCSCFFPWSWWSIRGRSWTMAPTSPRGPKLSCHCLGSWSGLRLATEVQLESARNMLANLDTMLINRVFVVHGWCKWELSGATPDL